MGAMVPPNRKSCYNFRVVEINRVLDGDTIDVTIDLGFDLFKKERVRVAGVDTPEKRTRDLERKHLESTQPTGLQRKLKVFLLVTMILLSALNLLAASVSMVVFWGGYTWGRSSVTQRRND